MPKDKAEYLNYEGSEKGSYSRQGHIGILARMHSHFDTLESSTFYRIVADRESAAARRPQYIHELCSRSNSQFRMYKLASLPIIFNAGILQMQMKQLSIFIEQVYLVYFGNYSETPHTQAILNRLQPEAMPKVQGIGANRQLPLSKDFMGGSVDMASFNALQSFVSLYFKTHGVTQLDAVTLADLFRQYNETGC
jgi:hypothetical protein